MRLPHPVALLALLPVISLAAGPAAPLLKQARQVILVAKTDVQPADLAEALDGLGKSEEARSAVVQALSEDVVQNRTNGAAGGALELLWDKGSPLDRVLIRVQLLDILEKLETIGGSPGVSSALRLIAKVYSPEDKTLGKWLCSLLKESDPRTHGAYAVLSERMSDDGFREALNRLDPETAAALENRSATTALSLAFLRIQANPSDQAGRQRLNRALHSALEAHDPELPRMALRILGKLKRRNIGGIIDQGLATLLKDLGHGNLVDGTVADFEREYLGSLVSRLRSATQEVRSSVSYESEHGLSDQALLAATLRRAVSLFDELLRDGAESEAPSADVFDETESVDPSVAASAVDHLEGLLREAASSGDPLIAASAVDLVEALVANAPGFAELLLPAFELLLHSSALKFSAGLRSRLDALLVTTTAPNTSECLLALTPNRALN